MFHVTAVTKGPFVYAPAITSVGGLSFYTVTHLYEQLRDRRRADQLTLANAGGMPRATGNVYSTTLQRVLNHAEWTWYSACRTKYRQSFPEDSARAIVTQWVDKYESEAALLEPCNASGAASELAVWISAPDHTSNRAYPDCLERCARRADALAAAFAASVTGP